MVPQEAEDHGWSVKCSVQYKHGPFVALKAFDPKERPTFLGFR